MTGDRKRAWREPAHVIEGLIYARGCGWRHSKCGRIINWRWRTCTPSGVGSAADQTYG